MYIKLLQANSAADPPCPLNLHERIIYSIIAYRSRLKQATTARRLSDLTRLHARGSVLRALATLESHSMIAPKGSAWLATDQRHPEWWRLAKNGLPATTQIPLPTADCPWGWAEIVYYFTRQILRRRSSLKGMAKLLLLSEKTVRRIRQSVDGITPSTPPSKWWRNSPSQDDRIKAILDSLISEFRLDGEDAKLVRLTLLMPVKAMLRIRYTSRQIERYLSDAITLVRTIPTLSLFALDFPDHLASVTKIHAEKGLANTSFNLLLSRLPKQVDFCIQKPRNQ